MGNNLTIRLAGDIMLGGGVLEKIIQYGPTYPFANLIKEKNKHAIFFGNLECSFSSGSGSSHPKRIYLHSHPEAAIGLAQSGINVVSLANNHTFDYGLQGFIQTKRILNEHGIKTVGGGSDNHEASQATTTTINGITVSFLGYCSKETGCQDFASPFQCGVADVVPETIFQDIAKVKVNSNIIIVSLHWGKQFQDYPTPENIALAKKCIDEGATIVVGHHTHVLQGIEQYKNGLILYDLGSLVFGDIIDKYHKFYMKKKKHREGILIDCLVNKKGIIDFNLLPIYINDGFQMTFPEIPHSSKILRNVMKRSSPINSDSYRSFYKRYLHRAEMIRLYSKAVRFVTNPQKLYRKMRTIIGL